MARHTPLVVRDLSELGYLFTGYLLLDVFADLYRSSSGLMNKLDPRVDSDGSKGIPGGSNTNTGYTGP